MEIKLESKYAPTQGVCKVCGKPADSRTGHYCGNECRQIGATMLVHEDETMYRPIKTVLYIMQYCGITYREYTKNRNEWHKVAFGGSNGK